MFTCYMFICNLQIWTNFLRVFKKEKVYKELKFAGVVAGGREGKLKCFLEILGLHFSVYIFLNQMNDFIAIELRNFFFIFHIFFHIFCILFFFFFFFLHFFFFSKLSNYLDHIFLTFKQDFIILIIIF